MRNALFIVSTACLFGVALCDASNKDYKTAVIATLYVCANLCIFLWR
jgi:hypothetical protein